ncbi:hypothetical protein SAMN05444275_12043 [Myroides odoratimimus subsp. xuanwuensis]|nr:hypothetical protein SAMN05444275_12043 [Myroides odoratimimus subsp. xuanwuensis]
MYEKKIVLKKTQLTKRNKQRIINNKTQHLPILLTKSIIVKIYYQYNKSLDYHFS